MMMLSRVIRNLVIILFVLALIAGVAFYILRDQQQRTSALASDAVTFAVATAIRDALFSATRTAEADIPHFRVVTLQPNEFLLDVAQRHDTTVEVLRMANSIRADVEAAQGGEVIIVPEGVQELNPPRRFITYTAITGDTLVAVAARFAVPESILREDNPILAQRGINPGDIIFIGELL
jgi:LysM repeat protein